MEDTMIITSDAPSKRRKVTKFALAGVAVFGVTAAATSAAWSDNVFFGAQAEAAEFELEGRNPTTGLWEKADGATAQIVLPTGILDQVGPGIADSYPLRIRNNGDLPIYLNQTPIGLTDGALFLGADKATVTFGSFSDRVLENRGDEATFTVIVTGDPDWVGSDYQGLDGTIVISVVGSSSAPAPI